MHARRVLFVGFLAGVAAAQATAQVPRLRTTRPLELHLAEDESAPGLLAVHVNGEARIVYVHREIQLDDHDSRSAAVVRDASGQPAVQVHLRKAGVEKFNAIVKGNAHKMLAIASKDQVVSVAYIEGTPLIDDLLDITGRFTGPEAAALARALSR